MRPLIELRGVSKRFGGTLALDSVDATFMPGAVHGLVGENGAGKSTLTKIACGRVLPDRGSVLVDGGPVHYRRPQDATRDGIAAVAQELAVLPNRSVLDNALCGSESSRFGFVSRAASLRRFDQLAETVGLTCQPSTVTGRLSLADQQKVEVMRALAQGARAIVFDEPTAKLPAADGKMLLSLMRQLAADGTAVILISHFLEEVLSTCTEVTVMRDGRIVRTGSVAGETVDSLVQGMLGRDLDNFFPDRRPAPAEAPVLLHATDVASPPLVRDVSLDVRAGEIVGMFGLVGSGRSEFARSLLGADKMTRGTATLEGRAVGRRVRSSIRAGLAMIPESRKTQGLMLNRSVLENITVAHLGQLSRHGWLHRRSERRRARQIAEAVGLTAAQLSRPARTLSGGNQQKVLFARWLLAGPKVLIVDEPTRGVDIGAKRNIYELVIEQAARGMGVVLISSELDEVVELSHRAVVLRTGVVAGETSLDEMTSDVLLPLAFAETALEEGAAHD